MDFNHKYKLPVRLVFPKFEASIDQGLRTGEVMVIIGDERFRKALISKFGTLQIQPHFVDLYGRARRRNTSIEAIKTKATRLNLFVIVYWRITEDFIGSVSCNSLPADLQSNADYILHVYPSGENKSAYKVDVLKNRKGPVGSENIILAH